MKTYITYPIVWGKEYEKEIQEVYRLFKDQEKKIFDLTWYDAGNNLMDFIEELVKDGGVFVTKDFESNKIAATFVLVDPVIFREVVLYANVHCAVSKAYWGKEARSISANFISHLEDNYKINRLIASVPQCGYGIIKLLKNMGFLHEGTVKRVLPYLDKNSEVKLYDKLIYSLDLQIKEND